MTHLVERPAHAVLTPIALQHLRTGGKRLRARLALAASAAFNAPPNAALAWATACELAHNATLVHDDLQDGDTLRRGRPSVWAEHGMAQAINLGDWLLMLPYTAIGEGGLDEALCWRLCQALASRMSVVIKGQAMECSMLGQGVVDRDSYVTTIRGKTSALFELPVYGAALLSQYSPAAAASLTEPFASLGMLFQMQDDVLDLYGDKGREACGSDLREGKVSALVVEHLALVPKDAPWLLGLLRKPRASTSDDDVQKAIDRFRDSGALQAVLTAMGRHARVASDAVAPPLVPLMNELIDLILAPIASLFNADP